MNNQKHNEIIHNYIEQKNYVDAIDYCSQKYNLSSSENKLLFYKGYCLDSLNKKKEAIKAYQKYLISYPNCTKGLIFIGVSLNYIGKNKKALDYFSRAIKLNSENVKYAWMNRGIVHNCLNEPNKAIADFPQALKIDPHYYDAWSNQWKTLDKLGLKARVLESCESFKRNNPPSLELYKTEGITLYELEQDRKALISLQKALEINQNDIETLYHTSLCLYNLKFIDESLKHTQKAITIIDKENSFLLAKLLILKGDIYQELKLYNDAVMSFNEAIYINISSHEAWHKKAIITTDIFKRHKEAVLYFDRAIEINSNKSIYWINKGITLNKQSKIEEAIFNFDVGINLNRSIALYWIQRAKSCQNNSVAQTNNYWTNLSPLVEENPLFKLRDYEGAIFTLEQGLKSQVDNSKEEGLLYAALGKLKYDYGKMQIQEPRKQKRLWNNAKQNYNKAFKIITDYKYPEDYLEIINEYIILLYLLDEDLVIIESILRNASSLLHQNILKDVRISKYKKQKLSLKHSELNQLTVDIESKRSISSALDLAERDKNAFLSWFFNSEYQSIEDISSSSWQEIQPLLESNTAMVYWHISPAAITTFIFGSNCQEPKVVNSSDSQKSILQVEKLNRWITQWNQNYTEYKNLESKKKLNSTWRTQINFQLQELKDILQIETIVSKLPSDITQLIIVPHRGLHLFPLDSLFPSQYKISRVPSIKAAIQCLRNRKIEQNQSRLLTIQAEADNLALAPVEVDGLDRIYNPHHELVKCKEIDLVQLIEKLQAGNGVIHFTGHGEHNFNSPAESRLSISNVREIELTARQIYQEIDLSNYQYTVLSACEMGSASNHNITTEYVGVSSILLAKGVKQVICSLWTIEEGFCFLLLEELHRIIVEEKQHPRNALNQAKNKLKNWHKKDLSNYLNQIYNRLGEEMTYETRKRLGDFIARIEDESSPEYPFDDDYYLAAFVCIGI